MYTIENFIFQKNYSDSFIHVYNEKKSANLSFPSSDSLPTCPPLQLHVLSFMYVPLSPPSDAHARVGAEAALEHGKSTSDHIPKEERSFSPAGHSWQQLLS